jgi:hypothetical protein
VNLPGFLQQCGIVGIVARDGVAAEQERQSCRKSVSAQNERHPRSSCNALASTANSSCATSLSLLRVDRLFTRR